MIVGLTGGVGAGKSTVAALLAEHGAVIIDADAIAREVVQAGTPGFDAVVARFGEQIVGADGQLDRPALAKIVFNDADALAALNTIVHPLVGHRSGELKEQAGDALVIYDVPLMAEVASRAAYDFVIVVEASMDVRLPRLEARGMPEADARARIAAQASDEQRRALADAIVPNDGDRAALRLAVDEVWAQLQARIDAE
jgi:dephospho-CoA kinase